MLINRIYRKSSEEIYKEDLIEYLEKGVQTGLTEFIWWNHTGYTIYYVGSGLDEESDLVAIGNTILNLTDIKEYLKNSTILLYDLKDIINACVSEEFMAFRKNKKIKPQYNTFLISKGNYDYYSLVDRSIYDFKERKRIYGGLIKYTIPST